MVPKEISCLNKVTLPYLKLPYLPLNYLIIFRGPVTCEKIQLQQFFGEIRYSATTVMRPSVTTTASPETLWLLQHQA